MKTYKNGSFKNVTEFEKYLNKNGYTSNLNKLNKTTKKYFDINALLEEISLNTNADDYFGVSIDDCVVFGVTNKFSFYETKSGKLAVEFDY